MADVIVIGVAGETWPYDVAGLTCYEPETGRFAERVLAERVRCEILAMTQAAFDRLPTEIAASLRESAWPALAIVPPVADVRAARTVVDRLKRTVGRNLLHAA